jgi:hypothetical protein
VRETPADAWVVEGASQEVLEWFIQEGILAFAMFGRRRGLPIAAAGPDKTESYRVVVRRLAALGHQRMVPDGDLAYLMGEQTRGAADRTMGEPCEPRKKGCATNDDPGEVCRRRDDRTGLRLLGKIVIS